jgi:hypothetical protein
MDISEAARPLARDLHDIFGDRLKSLVAYEAPGPDVHTLAIVDDLSAVDLAACARKVEGWHERRLATPLLLATHEFERSLDVFPLEFGAIVSDHTLIAGTDPFPAVAVDPADVRRACEVQARSHLLHLREGYVETRGDADRLAMLIVESAAPLAALLRSIERLDPAARRLSEGVADQVLHLNGTHGPTGSEAEHLFPQYLVAVERIVQFVDGWSSR